MSRRRWIFGGIVNAILLIPAAGFAQTTTQVWANVILDWARSHKMTLEIDVEPKVQTSAPPGNPGWWNLEVTPSINYALTNGIDVVGEVVTGRTRQTDDLDSIEVTPRVGLLFHLFSRQDHLFLKEKLPKRRLVIRDLVRLEGRNLFYSDDTSDSVVRFRNRLEFLLPLNRPNLSEAGTFYLQSDWEWYIPLSDPQERFANRQRIRAGAGFRQDAKWRYVMLYIWDRSRDTTREPFSTTTHCFDLQIRRTW